MPTIIPVVEGDGEIEAVPLLLRRILHERHQHWDWTVGKARRIGGIGKLDKELDNLLQRLASDPKCDAILVTNDLDDGCPMTKALELAQKARALALPCPIAIVLAHHEYEAWFLASIATIAGNYGLPAGLTHSGEVETKRGVKEWLDEHMPSGKKYKETSHQAKMTALLDIDLALAGSRSFRRLYHAVEELVLMTGKAERGYVTPGFSPTPVADPPSRRARRLEW